MKGQIFLLEGNGEVFGGLEGGQIELHVLHSKLFLWMLLVHLFLHTLYSLCGVLLGISLVPSMLDLSIVTIMRHDNCTLVLDSFPPSASRKEHGFEAK